VEQSSTTTTSATHGCASSSRRTAATAAHSMKTGMMTETLGVVVKNAQSVSQRGFAAHQKRRKTVPDECDELVTILSLALFGRLPINTKSVRDFLFQVAQYTIQQLTT
jgi:hypothetical protein